MAIDVNKLLGEDTAKVFKPYYELSNEADALTVYFKPDADYSKRLTDHVTLFLSLDTTELIGCRIKGIAGILEDLPNYIHIAHDGVELSIIIWSFRGGIQDERTRRILNELNELAKKAGDMVVRRTPSGT